MIFCPFILLMGFLREEYSNGLPFPPPADHILSSGGGDGKGEIKKSFLSEECKEIEENNRI